MRTKVEFQPGFKLSVKQYFTFWREWRKVIEVQGWDGLTKVEMDAHRHELLRSCGFASLKDVDHRDGCDRVFAALRMRQDIVVNESEDAGQRRRFLHRIGEQAAELWGMGYGDGLATVLKERFKVMPGVREIGDLTTIELERCVMTLDRCIADEKEAARDEKAAEKAMDIDEDLAGVSGDPGEAML